MAVSVILNLSAPDAPAAIRQLADSLAHAPGVADCPRLLADTLAREGIKTTLVEVHTLKPLDTDTIAEVLGRTRAAVTLEDHNINGGLGSAVAEVIAERQPASLVRLGLRDVFAESGDAELLFDKYQMGAPHVMEAVKQVMLRKRAGLAGEPGSIQLSTDPAPKRAPALK